MRSTLEDIQKLETVAERDIDLLFIEELSISKSFRSWIYGMVWETNNHDLPFLGAWHSLIHPEYGESDIPAIFKDSHDHKTAILIENKIDALAQPNQAARYRSRGDAGIEKAWWHKYRTCIIAPEAYLNSNTEAEHYDVRISYESVKSWVWQGSPDIRNRYRAEVMENAIVQSRRVSKVLPMRCLLTSSSLLNDARCFLRSCDMSRSSSTATAVRILGAGPSLNQLSENPGPPQPIGSWELADAPASRAVFLRQNRGSKGQVFETKKSGVIWTWHEGPPVPSPE